MYLPAHVGYSVVYMINQYIHVHVHVCTVLYKYMYIHVMYMCTADALCCAVYVQDVMVELMHKMYTLMYTL